LPLSAKFRAALDAALGRAVEIQPKDFANPSAWSTPDSAYAQLRSAGRQADIMLANQAAIDGEKVQTIRLLSEAKIVSADPDGSLSNVDIGYGSASSRIHSATQLSYMTIRLTLDLLRNLRTRKGIVLPSQARRQLADLFISAARLDGEGAPPLDSSAVSEDDLWSLANGRLDPPDPAKAQEADRAVREAVFRKLSR
jgi:hypothetical protein